MTQDQKELLEYAIEAGDRTILCVGGGLDDKLWQSFMTKGWMEPAPLPDGFRGGLGGLNWTAWRITDKGATALHKEKP